MFINKLLTVNQQQKFSIRGLIILSTTSLLIGCSSGQRPEVGDSAWQKQVSSPKNLSTLSKKSISKSRINPMRMNMLRDTALSIGARAGLAHQAGRFNKILEARTKHLDRVFNLYNLVLEHNVLPPVLVESQNNINVDSNTIIRTTDRNYRIERQAKFVSTAPHWRDYLWLNYQPPEMPDKSLLPRDKEEQVIWRNYISQGWQAGLKQALLIFNQNLAKLQRDYLGMVKYLQLVKQNIISKPYIASTSLGITGDANSLSINDKIIRITALPELQSEQSQQWKTNLTLDVDEVQP